MKVYMRLIASVLALTLSLTGCGQGEANTVKLDPDNPVNISIWHYYNDSQHNAFENLLEQFNQTVGKEMGIYVEGHSQGNVSDLEKMVLAAFNKEAGAENPPDIFSSYADTAYAIDQMGVLVNLEDYLTEKELDTYVNSFIEEGRIGPNGELRIFPVAKSSEIFMMNKTDWDKFSKATGADIAKLSTLEGVTETAKAYYEWTDSLTPDVANDGKAFYGRDAMANLFIVGAKQFGDNLFHVENGEATLHLNEALLRGVWENYYVPYVMGWFSSFARFRADDVKISEVIAYTGSTASALYFPDTLESGDDIKEIEYMVLPAPGFAEGEKYAVQQGAGMVVTKSTPEREYAAITFLKWFTEEQNNLEFGGSSGYLPVKKSAMAKEKLDQVIAEKNIDIANKTYDTLTTCFTMVEDTSLYTGKAFLQGSNARNVLEYQLSDKAKADRETVVAQMAEGMTLEEAAAAFISEEAYAAWSKEFQEALEAVMVSQPSASQ